ncbi:acetate uptake transporter [Bauldia sp.]|uniref:acetate uptake transporter n=1 Tax=Bauldia sp. TaxID=2575872 RepID=UPI003BAD3E7F
MSAANVSGEPSRTIVADTTANPAPLGLSAFGLTTILLNFHNAGFYPLDAMILAMGVFYGGLAQVLAGVMEWRKGNTFGTTAFTSYGLFWLSLAGILIVPDLGIGTAPGPAAMATYLAIWGLFTAVLFIATFKLTRSLQVVFLTLTILFGLLALANGTESEMVLMIAGYEGILCGAVAVYTGLGQVLNEIYGRTVCPL